jgi:O-succinylbenzoate synthase
MDESLVTYGYVQKWAGAGWGGVYVVKPSLLADPRPALQRLAGLKADVVFSSALETSLGARAALRLAFKWPGRRLALGFGVWPLFADARFDGPYTTPFLSAADVNRLEPETVWSALT